MGSCASFYRRSEGSALKTQQPVGSVMDKFEIPPSPIKHFKLHNESVVKDISVISHNKTPSGSKEETFFDSRGWLDSDCEDFFSVKGDFTPSCGNTPLHHPFPAETPRVSNDQPPTFNPPPPLPPKRRKKLAELFRESYGNDACFAFLNLDESQKVDEPCVSGTGSVCSSERTVGAVGDDLNNEKPMRFFGSKLCCLPLPPLVSQRHSSSERKENLKVAAMAKNDVEKFYYSPQKQWELESGTLKA